MFDRGDLAVLLLWLGISLVPLATIYFVLKTFSWSTRDKQLLNAWLIWLTWLLSTYSALIAMVILIASTSAMLSGWTVIITVVFSAFFVGTAAICVVIGNLRARSAEVVGLEVIVDSPKPSALVVLHEAIVINVLACASSAAGIVVVGLILSGIDRIFPQQGPFAIYDIL